MDAVPETFVDAFGEISFKHGMIRIELVSFSDPEPRVTQRLITSLQAFQHMLQSQQGMMERLEKAGVVRSAEPPAAATAPERSGVGVAVRRLLRVEPAPQPAPAAPPQSELALPPQPELAPPRSPNFSDE